MVGDLSIGGAPKPHNRWTRSVDDVERQADRGWMPRAQAIPLPRSWPEHVKSALLHAVALAHFALSHARGWCADSRIARVRLAAERDRWKTEAALLGEELRIKDARLEKVSPANRPHYSPSDRLAILALRASRGWTLAEAARRFLLTPATLASWMHRLDEQGEDALVRLAEPVNRFPDFVRVLLVRLRALLPTMGKVRISQMLARAGLHLAPTTVRRLAKEALRPPPRRDPAPAAPTQRRVVTARYPHHVWHMDLSAPCRHAGNRQQMPAGSRPTAVMPSRSERRNDRKGTTNPRRVPTAWLHKQSGLK